MIFYKELYSSQEAVEKWLEEISVEVAASYPIDRVEETIPEFKRNVAVDLGANIGLFSINAAATFKHVYAFEAVPFLASIASHKLNIQHGFDNVIVNRLAASDKTGEIIKIYKSKSGHPGDNTVFDTDDMNLSEYDYCLTISLEDIFRLIDHDYIDYMKIDIEGSEYPFLMNKDLSNIGVIAMEIHEYHDDPTAMKKLQDHMSQYMHGWKLDKWHLICINKKYEIDIPPKTWNVEMQKIQDMEEVF
tara:strand:+ start:14600 stop:15337 length:738 start_codon:yes stop_codon:yes gene_type:complete